MLRKTLLILSTFVMMQGVAHADEHVYQEVTAEQLQQLKKTLPTLKIIDSRGEDQIQDGMIQGAINLPVYDTDAQQLASIAQDKTTPLAFYCNDKYCSASAIAANKAFKAGYTKIFKYTGGIAEWKAKKLPVQP
jgi:rhodanese-related sulfurtransferase